MRTRRLALLGPVLLALAALGFPASAADAPGRADPRDLQELRIRVAPLAGRLTALFELAEKDPRWARVQLYQSYKQVNFDDKKREVRAAELYEILRDKDADFPLRQEVVKALTGTIPKAFDKDIDAGSGSRSKRDDMSMRYVWPLLDDDKMDPAGRQLAHDFLVAMHGQQTDADILSYKAREPKTWKAAKKAWQKVLR